MSGFLYFVPDTAVPRKPAAAGLGYALGTALERGGSSNGPNKTPGVIWADPGRVSADLVGYHPARQTWRKIPGSDCWVGMTNGQAPKPTELERTTRIAGHLVQLSDGELWECPVARAVVENDSGGLDYMIALPTRSRLNDAGEWEPGAIHPKYDQLWQYAVKWWDFRMAALASLAGREIPEGETQTVKFGFGDSHAAATLALQTNYVIGAAEADLLGLFDDACLPRILNALVDEPTIEEWSKKKLRQRELSASVA